MSHTQQTADDRVVMEPEAPAAAAVIWLHGLGADGFDFVPVVPELRLPEELPVRFVFPHAPQRAVTINAGTRMRAWYDIKALDRDGPEDEDGIRESAAQVSAMLDQQREAGIAAERLVLAGFSQGGAIALHAGLRYAHPLAGLLALSTYLPLRAQVVSEASDANRATPIQMMHGSLDPMLPMALGEMSRDLLVDAGYHVDWHDYPMQHQVCLEQIQRISAWLIARFGG